MLVHRSRGQIPLPAEAEGDGRVASSSVTGVLSTQKSWMRGLTYPQALSVVAEPGCCAAAGSTCGTSLTR